MCQSYGARLFHFLAVHYQRTADLAFLFDGSDSVTLSQFNQQIQYSKSILDDMDVAEDRVHVAAASFSKTPRVHFTFNNPLTGESRTLPSVNNLLNNIGQDKGLSRIGRGLQIIDRDIFSRTGGHRVDDNPAKVLVVVVIGISLSFCPGQSSSLNGTMSLV